MKRTLNEWIEKAKKVHGDKYDYSKSTIKNCKIKTTFICPIHGEFEMTWDNHVNGKQGCPKCNKSEKLSTQFWIDECKKKHGNKYDYSKSEYINAKTKICVICHEKDENGIEHGEFFIRPDHHINGTGCPKCCHNYHYDTPAFIEKAKKVHGDKYDYSKSEYVNNKRKICIICHEKDENGIEHGEFYQDASFHLNGGGCPKCKGGITSNKSNFVKKASIIHNNFYDYSSFNYINARTKGLIKCPIHGDFLQAPFSHLNGRGCPKCKFSTLEQIVNNYLNKEKIEYIYQYPIKTQKNQKGDFFIPSKNIIIECQGEQHFIPVKFSANQDEKSNFDINIENDKIKYNFCLNNNIDIVYFTLPILLKDSSCIEKNSFYSDKKLFTTIYDLIEYIKKAPTVNKTEAQFSIFLDSIRKNITQNIIILPNNAIQIKNIVIKYQILCKNNKNELNDFRRECLKAGKKCLIIFEDEFIDNEKIVLSKIKHICKIDNDLEKIPGRKCQIKDISSLMAEEFLLKNHIQGYAKASIYIGAFFKDKLVAVMGFLKENSKTVNWTLVRFASDINYICQGIGGKLFTYFIRNYDYNEIKSFADKRWTINLKDNIYLQLGFKEEKNLYPDYYYFNILKDGIKRFHKFNFRKKILNKKYGLSLSLTEFEMTKIIGYEKIWNCGLIKYVYSKKG